MDASLDTDVVALGLGVAPFISLLINPLKKYMGNHEDLILYLAIAIGLAWTLVYYWTQGALAKDTIMATILLGVATGAAAIGSYDLLKTVTARSVAAKNTVESVATGVSTVASLPTRLFGGRD